jgi:hypothetical protein
MKNIKIEFTVNVDLEAYAQEYGVTEQEAIERIKELIKVAGCAELTTNGYIEAKSN